VGEFRLDYAGEPLPVGNSPRLYLGFGALVQYPYVSKVQLSPPTEAEDALDWMEIDWTGELEWLFDECACQVVHGDQASAYPAVLRPYINYLPQP
jgi:hypothetical protein